jgi:hypothetical protein
MNFAVALLGATILAAPALAAGLTGGITGGVTTPVPVTGTGQIGANPQGAAAGTTVTTPTGDASTDAAIGTSTDDTAGKATRTVRGVKDKATGAATSTAAGAPSVSGGASGSVGADAGANADTGKPTGPAGKDDSAPTQPK